LLGRATLLHRRGLQRVRFKVVFAADTRRHEYHEED
jgi:hypothetical protein